MNRLRDMQRVTVDGADIIPYDPLRSFNPGTLGAGIIRGLHPRNGDRTEDFNNISAGGAFVLSPGNYSLGANPIDNDKGIVGIGAKFPGTITPREVLDAGITNKSALWSAKSASDGYANYAHAAQLVALPSGDHSRRFESAAHMASVVCYDESTYISDGDATHAGEELSARDYVVNDGGMFVPGGLNLKKVRVWGFNKIVSFGRSAADNGTVDGLGTCAELRLDNWGQDNPNWANYNSKSLVQVIAGGNKRSTAMMYLGRSGQTGSGTYWGYTIDATAVSRYAFALMNFPSDGVNEPNAKWGVTPEGAEEFKGGFTPPNPDTGRVRTYFDILGRLFALFEDGTSRLIVGDPKNIHIMTSGGAYNAGPADEGVIVKKTVASATFIAMPQYPEEGQIFFVKDGKGDALSNPITIVVLENEYPINSGSSYVIDKNDGSVRFIFKSGNWYSI